MNLDSILSAVASDYQSALAGGSTAGAGSPSIDFKHMTIGQIRDMTDQMAIAGKLTTSDQMALIAGGLQDLNANDPSYQPAAQTGYSRADAGTYDVVDMMNNAANFADSVGNFQSASAYKGAADAIQQYEDEISGANTDQNA